MLINGTLFSVAPVICMKHLSQAWSIWGGWVSHSCLLLSSCHWSVSHKEISWRVCTNTIREQEGEIRSMALLLRLRGNGASLTDLYAQFKPWELQAQAAVSLHRLCQHISLMSNGDQLNTLIRAECFWAAEARFLERGGRVSLSGSRMNVCTQTNRFSTWSPCRVGKESCSFAWEPIDIFVLVNAQP